MEDKLDDAHQRALDKKTLEAYTKDTDRWSNALEADNNGMGTFERNFANAIELAVILRAADIKKGGVDVKVDSERFLDVFKQFSVKDGAFTFDVIDSLLEVVLSKEEINNWELPEMSDWLQGFCVDTLKKTLEKVRGIGGEMYKRVVMAIDSLDQRVHPVDEYVVGVIENIPKRIADEIEKMLNDTDVEVVDKIRQERLIEARSVSK